jgi:hypothetical protein
MRLTSAEFAVFAATRPGRWTVMTTVCMMVGLAAHGVLAASEVPDDSALDAAFQTLTKLEPGQDLQLLNPIELAIIQARGDDTVRTDLETRLVAVLQGAATDLAKDYVCRQLPLIGSDACVAAVAELLPNPRLSYMARYALEGLGTQAAIRALRDALGKTEGRQQVGVVTSLGRLADAEAVAPLAVLLASENAELCEVAIVALGRIGNQSAAAALQEFAPRTPAALHPAVIDAQLAAAESLCRRGEYAAASEICESLQMADSELVRAAAFRGLLAARPAESLTLILAGLTAAESWKRAVAADCLSQVQQPAELAKVAAAIADLPTPGKIAALTSVQDRCDPSLRAVALKLLGQADASVQRAALSALIASAAPDDVPMLAGLAANAADPTVRDAAAETVRLMPANGTNEALLALLQRDTNPQPVLLRCALSRRSSLFVPAFLQAAESAVAETRQQAFLALEVMATPAEASALIGLLCKSAPGEEREAADRAVWMSCQQIPDPATRSALLKTALAQADAAGKRALLPTFARMGGEEALAAVHEAMQSSDRAVRDAGHRALANWPDASVAGELLDIVKSSEVDAYRIWSLRAYARVVSLPSERPAQTTYEMLNSAMALATRTEDKELIIARLGAVRVPDALDQLLAYVDQPELRSAALPAVFTLAKGLSQSHPEQARAALEKIRPLTEDAAMLQQIPKVLRDMEARKQ